MSFRASGATGTTRQNLARQTPTREPTQLFIGSAWSWDRTYSDFPADESWQLAYSLRGAHDLDFAFGTEVTAASSGAAFEVRVPKATTDNILVAGGYRLIGRVSKTDDEFDGTVVYNGHLLLLADPTTAVDAKSFNRQMLEAIEEALVAGVPMGAAAQRVTINGRTIEYRTTDDLNRLHASYLARVAVEENPNGVVIDEAVFVRA